MHFYFACLVSLAQRERVELPGWDLERNTPWRNLKGGAGVAGDVDDDGPD